MFDITCFVGRLRPDIQLNFPLEINGRSIPQHFQAGSQKENGQAAIRLKMDSSRFNESIATASEETTAFTLNTALAKLTKNSIQNNNITNIGLILADRFKFNKNVLGLMFDFGFNPGDMDVVDSDFTDVPREGCAIFLDAISDIRPITQNFQREVVFTATHELGHVFNLWHTEDPVSFMSSSMESGPFANTDCSFKEIQQNFLRRAEFDTHVQPGRTKFEDRGAFGPAFNDPFKKTKPHPALQLAITTSQKEFWFFEPVELDIKISSKQGEFILPNEVDPGYDRFVIHITRPNGTTFKYRSPCIYCHNTGTITVAPRKPFIRDISIFGQSGGYTFQSPGEYKVQCVFDTGNGRSVTSNVLSLNVLEPSVRRAKYRELQSSLTRKGPALLLYHRNGTFRSETVHLLEHIARIEKRTMLGINIMYALAKFKGIKKRKLRNDELKQLSRMTNTALDSGKLGLAREKNLYELKKRFEL